MYIYQFLLKDYATQHPIILIPFLLECVALKPEFNQDDGKQNIIYNYKIADYGNLAWHDQYFSF